MLPAVLIFILSASFFFLKLKTRESPITERSKKVTAHLDRYLLFVPMLAVAVFALLFMTVLQGRLAERSSHALLILGLWVQATSLYVELLKHFKNKAILAACAVGSAFCVALAILLTPLERYISLLYSHLYGFAFLLGPCVLAFFYAGDWIAKKR